MFPWKLVLNELMRFGKQIHLYIGRAPFFHFMLFLLSEIVFFGV